MKNIEAAKIAIESKIKNHYDKVPNSCSPEFEMWCEEMAELIKEQGYLERYNQDDEEYQSCSNEEYFGPNDD
jgi:hypothetical protein